MKIKSIIAIAVTLALLLTLAVSTPVSAAKIHVPGNFTTIQEAVDAASPGVIPSSCTPGCTLRK